MAELTERQKQFVSEYLLDLNATQAAIRAGYSAKTAYSQGQRLLKKVEVQAAIQKSMKRRSCRVELTQDRVLQELAAIGFYKATDYAQIEDSLLSVTPTAELTAQQAAAIAEIKQGTCGVEIKLHNKLRALELLGKHLGMFKDRSEEDAVGGGVVLLAPVLEHPGNPDKEEEDG